VSTPEDIDCEELGADKGEWLCNFRLVGERCLNFEVNETNTSGFPTDKRGVVEQPSKFRHACTIRAASTRDLRDCLLMVDGRDFGTLPQWTEAHAESNLNMDVQAFINMYRDYGINMIPYKSNYEAPKGLTAVENALRGAVAPGPDGSPGILGSLLRFPFCCLSEQPNVDRYDQPVPPPQQG